MAHPFQPTPISNILSVILYEDIGQCPLREVREGDPNSLGVTTFPSGSLTCTANASFRVLAMIRSQSNNRSPWPGAYPQGSRALLPFFQGFHSQCPADDPSNPKILPSFTLSTTLASLNTPANGRVSLTVPEPASHWIAFSVAIHALGVGCSPPARIGQRGGAPTVPCWLVCLFYRCQS